MFLEQRGNHINLLVQFTKHQQSTCQVGDSRALSFVEKEAMAPHTTGELAGGMAHSGHIYSKNYEFISIKGPAPVSTHGYDLNICHGDPEHVAHSGHSLKTTSNGRILEFTYLEGPVPSLVASHVQVSCPRNQRITTHNELA